MPTNEDRVAITGIGVLSPIGNGVPEFNEGLKNGECAIGPIEAFDTQDWKFENGAEISDFEPEDYFSTEELRRTDRCSQILLTSTEEAVRRSGLNFEEEETRDCGVMVSTTLGGTISGMEYYEDKVTNEKVRPSKLLDYPLYSSGSRIASRYGLEGPNVVLSTACSSGNVAISYATDLIRTGDKDVMITGGVDTMAQLTWAGFGILRNVSPTIPRPFDNDREGLVLGEASATLVLEDFQHALDRGAPIFGEVKGRGLSSDASDMTAPDQTGEGPAMAMEKALNDAELAPENVDYINAHGTGTEYNDMVETKAIKKLFGESAYDTPVSSTKSQIGHTLGACGVVEAVAVLLSIRDNYVPPTVNYETPDPECDLDYVPNESRESTVNYGLSNGFGFGGNNCSVVLGRSDESKAPEESLRNVL